MDTKTSRGSGKQLDELIEENWIWSNRSTSENDSCKSLEFGRVIWESVTAHLTCSLTLSMAPTLAAFKDRMLAAWTSANITRHFSEY